MSWNPFKQQAVSDPIQDLIDALDQANPTITSAGAQQAIPGGLTTTGGSIPAQLSATSLSQMLQSFRPASQEEVAELEGLRASHQAEIKRQKLIGFKKLPKEMRQFVINAISWNDSMKELNSIQVEKSPRHIELERKTDLYSNFYNPGSSASLWHKTMPVGLDMSLYEKMYASIGLPDGVTAEDLKLAHVEATMEEEMLNGED